MKIKPLVLLLIWMGVTHFSFAQTLEICYEQIPGIGNVDTVNIYFSSNADTAVQVRAVQVSIAFQSSCTSIQVAENEFSNMWGTFLEATAIDSNFTLTYNGSTYNGRFAYGNADPGNPMEAPLLAPTNQKPGIFAMKLLVSGSCRDSIYFENETENPINQIGNQNFNRIPYLLGLCSVSMSLGTEFEANNLALYPNPAASKLTIEWEDAGIRRTEVRILDAFGRARYSGSHSFSSPVSVDVTGLSAGVYFVGLYRDKGELIGSKRFVKL